MVSILSTPYRTAASRLDRSGTVEHGQHAGSRAEAGIKYYGDYGQHDDQPFPLRVKSGRLITLPYSSNLGDAINERQGHEADDFAQFICDYFDTLYEEGVDQGRVLP